MATDLRRFVDLLGPVALPKDDAAVAIEAFRCEAVLAERVALRAALFDHWVTGIVCDHEAKTDRVTCSCSVWRCPPQPCVGDAIKMWINHVFEQAGMP
jgi:hypothetical protein